MSGDHACAEGSLAAGLGFFAGYPITPSTEIAEHLAIRLSQVGGTFAQMEDELGSMAAIVGASVAGARSMTATSGPGFSLMMENVGLAVMMEVPCVVVNVQRGSPSTGLPTAVGQADVMQARWGSHGDYAIVAYSPASPQEFFDLTLRAFDTADTYRVPVFLMADEVVGHMTERVVIPPASRITRVQRKRLPRLKGNGRFLSFHTNGKDLVPALAHAGEGYRAHFTSLTHDERGYPTNSPDVHDRLVRRLVNKIKLNAGRIVEAEEYRLKDAEVVVVAYGCMSRSARRAVDMAREKGIRAGLLRPVTLWPFPESRLRELDKGKKKKAFVVAELNLGQMAREVERCIGRPPATLTHAGGKVLEPEAVLEVLAEAGR
ncbi:MAG: 2-oxoacid:acceptor oxidoreductase subunit alpha [Elusimicrobia bacterium]|nr:2-oxoacid:acceptor oxidoreductase subunit alpha [Elusimicrobiota bacterium]